MTSEEWYKRVGTGYIDIVLIIADLAASEAREAALREAAQELWNAVAHDVTDESKWVGTAMGKLQAVLASVGK